MLTLRRRTRTNRNEINRQATRTAIKKAFIDLYTQKDITSVTLKEICELSNISKTMFYRYYADKYSVLEEIENDLLQELIAINQEVLKSPFTGFHESTSFPMFRESAAYIKRNTVFFTPILRNDNSHFFSKWKKNLRTDFRNFLQINGFKESNLSIITALFSSIIMGVYTFWLLERPDITIDEISAIGGNSLTAIFKEFAD